MRSIQDPEKQKQINEYFDQISEVHKEYYSYWLDNTLWHWDFWLSLLLTLLPWLVWFALRRKESQGRLLLSGMFVIIISSWFDFLGVIAGLWFYTGKVIPTIPSYIPWDFCLLPVTVMLTIQYKPTIKPWMKGIFYAGLTAFVGEPFFKWVGIYVEQSWSEFYSFPIYFVIYLLADRVSKSRSFAPIVND